MMHHRLLTFALLFLATFAGRAAAEDTGVLPLSAFAALKNVRTAAVSPDGRDIACLVGITDLKANRVRMELWLVPMGKGQPARLTLESDAIDTVVWAPAGRRLAVVGRIAAPKPKEEPHTCLWVLDLAAGVSRRVTRIDRGNHYHAHQGASLCWSPDGAAIAYLAADPGSRPVEGAPIVVGRIQYKTRTALSDNRLSHIWLVDVATSQTRRLTGGTNDEHSIDWSPRGDEIVFCSNRGRDPDANLNYDIFTVKVADGTIRQLTKTAGTEMAPVWSPDGRSIAYTMTKRPATTIDSVAEDDHVWVLDLESGKARELTAALDRRCSHVHWGDDSKTVYFLARDRGKSLIYRVPSAGGKSAPVFTLKAMISTFSPPTRAGKGACVLATPTQPPEVWTFTADDSERLQRTGFNAEIKAEWPLVEPREVSFKSFDGTPVEGWLMLPAGAAADKKAPLILYIHGGPHGMYGYQFSTTFQLLCDRGYAILYLNPRGSNGYGQRFSDGCVNDWGGGDYKDLMAGLDHVLAKYPEIDPARLGVTGGSYGGYMTNWIITQTDRFKAAVSYAGLSNLISFYATSLYQDLIHVEFGGMPWERYDILWERSPLRYIKKAKTPTLILHGEADNDVHITQSEELFTALRQREVPTLFVRYPNEGHGATEPRYQLDQLERTAAWFQTYLRKR